MPKVESATLDLSYRDVSVLMSAVSLVKLQAHPDWNEDIECLRKRLGTILDDMEGVPDALRDD